MFPGIPRRKWKGSPQNEKKCNGAARGVTPTLVIPTVFNTLALCWQVLLTSSVLPFANITGLGQQKYFSFCVPHLVPTGVLNSTSAWRGRVAMQPTSRTLEAANLVSWSFQSTGISKGAVRFPTRKFKYLWQVGFCQIHKNWSSIRQGFCSQKIHLSDILRL